MANRYYQSFRIPFISRVFWREISEDDFRERVSQFVTAGTALDDLVTIMGSSRSIVLTDERGRSFKCITTRRNTTHALVHHQ